MIDGLHVNVLNPRKKTGGTKGKRKNMAKRKTPPRGPGGKFRKRRKGGGKGRRKNNPGGGGGKRKSPRKSNPNGNSGGAMTIASGLRGVWPRILGTLWVVWAVRRWGGMTPWGTGSLIPGAPATASPFQGRSWTMSNYIIGYLALKFAAGMMVKFRGSAWAHQFFHGGFDSLVKKLVWTEAFARSPWLQQQFGQTPGQVITDPNTGQTYMNQNGNWQALQGAHGQLATQSPMDGTDAFGQLITATALDGGALGQVVQADALDGLPGDPMPTLQQSQSPYSTVYLPAQMRAA